MPLYLIKFADIHPEFRLPELQSLAQLHGIPLALPLGRSGSQDSGRKQKSRSGLGEEATPGEGQPQTPATAEPGPRARSVRSPFLVLELRDDAQAALLVSRSILAKEVVRLWGHGPDRAAVLASMRAQAAAGTATPPPWAPYQGREVRWRLDVDCFGITFPHPLRSVVEDFDFLGMQGPVCLREPEVLLVYYEEYLRHPGAAGQPGASPSSSSPTTTCPKGQARTSPDMAAFGVLVGRGARSAIHTYDLKKRDYLGTTSMDPELSLIMSNQGLVRPGSLVLDPFMGTGSFIYTTAHFGAYVVGSDIDGRQIRGLVKNARMGGSTDGSVERNVADYGLQSRYLGALVTDMASHCWRRGLGRSRALFDAILTDPPYGVRAGAKKITSAAHALGSKSAYHRDGQRRYPATEEYEMEEVILDLVAFAAEHLVPGGRLVFWLPTVNEGYHPGDIPRHPRLRLVANSEQNFGRWSRRLITMERVREGEVVVAGNEAVLCDQLSRLYARRSEGGPIAEGTDEGREVLRSKVNPGHANFRHNYFAKGAPSFQSGSMSGKPAPGQPSSRQAGDASSDATR